MIIILHEQRHLAESKAMAAALRESYPGLAIQLIEAGSTKVWPASETWSDVLVVPFDGGPTSPHMGTFVDSLAKHATKPFILPVSLAAANKVPPAPLNEIKALPFEAGSFDQGVRRIGARLGLALRSRNHTIFISYRQLDGLAIAEQFEAFLKEEGYHVWRDDSKDQFDGQTMIAPGEPVQAEIEESLKRADLLLLLDTPKAAESRWIKLEVDLANGNLIPVLPVLFRSPGERVSCSRFRALETLQRASVIDRPGNNPPGPLTPVQLAQVLNEMETYLCEIFQRRLRVPHIVRQHFDSVDFDWNERDRFIFEAVRRGGGRVRTRVYSHCSIFDGIYDPALRAFVAHLDGLQQRANYALYVYDGLLIPAAQLEEVERAAHLEDSTDVILLHHQEVLTLLKSNFQKL